MIEKILNYFKYAWVLIKKNVAFFVLIIFQMAIISFSINAIIAYSSSQNLEIKYAKQLNCNNALYSMGASIDEAKENLVKTNTIMQKYYAYGRANSENAEITAYMQEAIELVDMSLYKGRWFTDNLQTNEVVVSNNLNCKIGDKISINVENKKIDANVVGILPKNFYYYRLSGGSSIASSMRTKFLFTHNESNEKHVFMSYEYLAANNLDKVFMSGGTYINFQDDITEQELDYNLTYLNNKSNVVSINKMIENSEDEFSKTILLVAPIIALVVILIITSAVFIIAITIHNSKKLLSTIYLYGAKWSDIKSIFLSYGIINIICSYIIYFLLDKVILKGFAIAFGATFAGYIVVPLISIIYLVIIMIVANKSLTKDSLMSNLKESL